MSKGILYVMSGPSGTGKGTICSELIEKRKINLSISTTSRNKRSGEIEGVTYHYTTEEEFKKNIENGEMLEWAVYNGNYYGTPKSKIQEMLDNGEDVLLEIEPQGALKVKRLMPEAILIFIVPPSMSILRERLVTRGRETEEQIAQRVKAATWEFSQSFMYNHIVVNNDLTKCVRAVMDIMDSHKKEFMIVEDLIKQQ